MRKQQKHFWPKSIVKYCRYRYIRIYSVFKKEGVKVKGYYIAKKWILGYVQGFFGTTRMGHLINCIILPKNFTLKLKKRPLNICGKIAKNCYFQPQNCNFFILRLFLNYKEIKMKYSFFPDDFKQLCLKEIVNLPKKAVFSILPFFHILNHALRFYGTNTQISQFKCKKIIEPDSNNQMSHSCGHNEPLNSSQSPFFSGVIAFYFNSFFFEHTVSCPDSF